MFVSDPLRLVWLVCPGACLLFASFCGWLVQAQDVEDLLFETIAVAEGLSASPITAIAQDNNGFMWFGTVDGLNRYDGYEFDVFRNITGDSTSISNSYVSVNGIATGEESVLWVGTREGLNKLDISTGRFFQYYHAPLDADRQPQDLITVVLPSPVGGVWVGTAAGISRLDSAAATLRSVNCNPENSVSSARVTGMVRGHDGFVWASTYAGILRLNESTEQCDVFSNEPTDAHSLPPGRFYSILEMGDGQIWAGSEDGLLVRYDAKTGDFAAYDLKNEPSFSGDLHFVLDLFEDADGRIWATLWDYGLVIFDPVTDQVTRYVQNREAEYGLPSNRPSVVFEDRNGLIWVGTWDGLTKIRTVKAFDHIGSGRDPALSFTSSRVKSVTLAHTGEIWAGTQEGLHRIDAQRRSVRLYRHEPENSNSLSRDQISSVIEDRDGFIWIGTEGSGLNRLDATSNRIERFAFDPSDSLGLSSPYVYKTFEDSQRRIWVGTTNGGLSVLNRQTGEFARFQHDPDDSTSLGDNEVWTVYEDQQGQFWVGTIGGGVNRAIVEGVDPLQIRFRRYAMGDSYDLASNNVVSIHQDVGGELWIGTMGGGLGRYDRERDRFVTAFEELSSENAGCILGDEDGSLWIGTSNGLVRFNPSTSEVHRYDERDGLESRVFYFDGCTKGKDGRMYFATDRGLVTFNPEDIVNNPIPPLVMLTNAYIFDRPAEVDTLVSALKRWTLPPGENVVTLQFAALDYASPSKNRYRYRIHEIDRDWIYDRGDRSATYSNLKPGTYQFAVEATNNDGLWSVQPARLEIVVEPAYWQTWWFRGIWVGFGSLLIAGFFVYRRRQRMRMEMTRRRIADNLHDDVGSSLSGIALYLEILNRNDRLSDEDREKILHYSEQTRDLVSDLRDIVWMVDSDFDNLGDLIYRMKITAENMTLDQKLEFDARTSTPALSMDMEQRRDLFLFFKEVLHNAVRHAKATVFRVQISYQDSLFQMEVSDNGTGFDLDTVKKGRGLRTLSQRAERLGAEMDIVALPGLGTRVGLRVRLT